MMSFPQDKVLNNVQVSFPDFVIAFLRMNDGFNERPASVGLAQSFPNESFYGKSTSHPVVCREFTQVKNQPLESSVTVTGHPVESSVTLEVTFNKFKNHSYITSHLEESSGKLKSSCRKVSFITSHTKESSLKLITL